jgi:capsid portal protein
MYAPNGKKDGIQLIPVSEVTAKDEFFNIKNVTRDDLLAAHRVPPQLMAIVPSNTGGFGAADRQPKFLARTKSHRCNVDSRNSTNGLATRLCALFRMRLRHPRPSTKRP